MSKIQKALNRIQGSGGKSNRARDARVNIDDSVVVAKLVDHGMDDDGYSSSDKCLHVDGEALRDAGLIAPDYHEQLLANQYRDIKRPLIAHAFGKRATKIERGNLIMVTSALSGEGKTFTSINLALSMARERDHSVLLVDADVAKPHTSEMFGALDEPGLLDLLENPEIPIRSLILPTDVDSLSVLPAGKPRLHATELLASSVMDKVCTILGQLSKGQIVIFDSPPMLQTSEAKVLGGLAGQIVMVIRAEETSQEAVSSALATLGEDQAVNLVLNQVRSGFGDEQYGYGYGQGYGAAYGRVQETADEAKNAGLFD
jgi:exopolysaccharide/PEP-CTERM locus tyrosine autokinase